MKTRLEICKELAGIDDAVLIGPAEVAAMCGYAEAIVKQRRVPGLPPPRDGLRLLRWPIGQIRRWTQEPQPEQEIKHKPGRPTKQAQIAARAAQAGGAK